MNGLKKKQKIVSVQADNLSKINVKTDTTLLLCHEAQNRKYKIFWYEPKNLSILNNKLFAKGYFVNFFYRKSKFYKKGKWITGDPLSKKIDSQSIQIKSIKIPGLIKIMGANIGNPHCVVLVKNLKL